MDLREKIGSGNTANVYRGFCSGQEVAVKQIDWNKSLLRAERQRAFDREVAVSIRVSHENLVRFLGVSSVDKPFNIITEYCSGGNCFELFHNCDHIYLTLQQQRKMCKDTALAMDYLHNFNPQIIHRDLKSLNLLLSGPVHSSTDIPLVKVSDFGLSRMCDEAGDGPDGWKTQQIGTYHWMAPEVYCSTNYDAKIDVYSYAMILFEILCREIPFSELEPLEIGECMIRGARPDLDCVPPNCPPTLKELMITCWDTLPANRPTFSEILALLDRANSGG